MLVFLTTKTTNYSHTCDVKGTEIPEFFNDKLFNNYKMLISVKSRSVFFSNMINGFASIKNKF